jgi:hypothetical protein
MSRAGLASHSAEIPLHIMFSQVFEIAFTWKPGQLALPGSYFSEARSRLCRAHVNAITGPARQGGMKVVLQRMLIRR